jgi:hypothetical protein
MMKNLWRYLLIGLLTGAVITFCFYKIPTNNVSQSTNHDSYVSMMSNFRGYPLTMCYSGSSARTDGIPGVTADIDTCNAQNIFLDFFIWSALSIAAIVAFVAIKGVVRK